MKVVIDSWCWVKKVDLGEVRLDLLRRKLTMVDSVMRSAIMYRSFQETDDAIGVPRAFFNFETQRGRDVFHDHDNSTASYVYQVVDKSADGAEWPERVPAVADAIWAAAQDGEPNELSLVDALTGVKPADFLSANLKNGLGLIVHAMGNRQIGDGIAIFSSEQAAVKVCLSVIKILKKRTLVLTPPGASLAMWRTVAGRFLPDAKICVIKRGECDDRDAHLTMGTIDDIADFIANGKMHPDEFGFVISHQLHRMDPIAWSKSTTFFKAGRRLGVADPSAMFNTGPARIFKYHLGPPVFCADPDFETPKVRRVWSGFKISSWLKVNPQFISKEMLMDHLCSSATYNAHVIEQIILAMKAGRKIVVASDRVSHLRTLKLQIESAWSGGAKLVDFAIDGMPPDDVSMALGSDVILTTFSAAKELPEVTSIDTIVLATPTKDPMPTIRMCQARDSSKKPPVIVDMRCDEIPVCKEYGKVRDALYRSAFGAESAQQ